MRSLLDAELIRNCFPYGPEAFDVITTCKLQFLELMCTRSRVDVALIDIRYPGRSAVDMGHQLLADRSVSRVLFLDRDHCNVRERLSRADGATYCSRNISLRDLLSVTAKLAKQEQLSPYDYKTLSVNEASRRVDPRHAPKVTERELDVWTLIGEGYSIAECSKLLGIAESTADNHKSRLMKKLKVNKSLELVRMAVRLGLVDP